jgi:hypothetical protein
VALKRVGWGIDVDSQFGFVQYWLFIDVSHKASVLTPGTRTVSA